MADLSLALAWCIATTLVVAGVGKVVSSKRTSLETAVGIFELGLAVALASHQLAQDFAIIAIFLTAVFAVRAVFWPPGDRCLCFGSRLPSSGPLAQRIRNTVLLLLAVLYFGTTLYAPHSEPALPFVDLPLGQVVGIAVVLLPWLLEWALAGDDQAAKFSAH